MADAHNDERFVTSDDPFADRYVTRREYYADHREILQRFGEQDLKFERMEGRSQRMLEDLDELPGALDKLGGTLSRINGRLTVVEDASEDLDGRMVAMESSIKGRTDHNTKIWLGIIAAIPLLVGAALTFAEIFFK